MFSFLSTALKGSFEKINVFTGGCLSIEDGGVSLPNMPFASHRSHDAPNPWDLNTLPPPPPNMGPGYPTPRHGTWIPPPDNFFVCFSVPTSRVFCLFQRSHVTCLLSVSAFLRHVFVVCFSVPAVDYLTRTKKEEDFCYGTQHKVRVSV